MALTGQEQHPNSRLPGLSRTRASVWVAMALERLWPLVLPLAVLASLFISLSWFGLFRLTPDWLRIFLLIAFALASAFYLFALRKFQAPERDEIDRRIEQSNHLQHAPILTQSDKLAETSHDAFAKALWNEHQKRMAAKLDKLAGTMPQTGVPERDPWGIRAVAFLLLVIASSFSLGPLGGSVSDAFRSHNTSPAITARFDAWVTPPAYTGRAPIFLTIQSGEATPTLRVAEGSTLTLRIGSGSGNESAIWQEAGNDDTQMLDAVVDAGTSSDRQFSTILTSDGTLTLKSGRSTMQDWTFSIIPDLPPSIHFSEDPKRAANGALDLNYEIVDDYGAVSAQAIFEPREAPSQSVRPLYEAPQMRLSLPRSNSKTPTTRTTQNLTDHPWAGAELNLSLIVEDGSGQKAQSDTKEIILPERPFNNGLAKALVEFRRLLAFDANSKPQVLGLMNAITLRPEDTIPNMSHYLGIMSARSRLLMAQTDDELRDVADYLWEIAITIEDGTLSTAEQRLQQAQEALQQALQDGAGDEEIERLMAELREAMNEYLRELAERAMQNPDVANNMPSNGQDIRQSDLDRLMQELENLARSGARDQAMDMLQQLQDIMNNLQAGAQQQGGDSQQSEMRQQMDQLGQMMRRQQEMMDETFRTDQQQPGYSDQPLSSEEFADAMRRLQEQQGELQKELQELQQSMEDMGLQPGQGFNDAGEAMRRAEEALGESNSSYAVEEQAQALEALRQGAQDMMQQMMQAMGEEGQGSMGIGQQGAGRDPLGRQQGSSGPDFGNSIELPDEIDVQRARRILDEIRRRLGNALSPEIEREYLERLLQIR